MIFHLTERIFQRRKTSWLLCW